MQGPAARHFWGGVKKSERWAHSFGHRPASFRSLYGSPLGIVAALAIAVGTLMTVASGIGFFAGRVINPATVPLGNYVRAVASGDEAFELRTATMRVYRGIVHEEPRHIRVSENWLQAGLGLLYAPIKTTQDTDRLIAGGIANCSERSQILKTIAESAGYDCRFVGLEGHVVLEVHDGGRWRMADPDYGVVFDVGVDSMALPEQESVLVAALVGFGHSDETISTYLQILQSTDDNTRLAVGSPLSPRLDAIERACGWLVWILPATAISFGLSPVLAHRAISAANLKRRMIRYDQNATTAIGMFAHLDSKRG
jgi:hypothetical protein